MKKFGFAFTCLLLLAVALTAKDSGESVDSGAFGVFISGRRVATETFSVQQQGGSTSMISAQIKGEDGSSSQHSELQITSTGTLVKYEWHEMTPGKSNLVVVPNNEFLLETVTQKPGDKPADQPFLLPTSTPILDNNFFIHREILAWRYLSSACTPEAAGLKCVPGEFGVLVPQGRTSFHLSIQPIGDEKITIRGTEQTLLHLDLKSEDGDWSLWLNTKDHYKLMRIIKVGEPVEVVRD